MSATYDPGDDTLLMRMYSSGVAIAVTTTFLVHALASGAHKSFAKRLSVAIVFGNWLHAIDDFAGIYWQSKTLCTIYGAVRSWSLLVCATWSVVLAAHIHHLLRHNRAIRVPEPWLHAVCWLLPAVLALLPLVDSLSYGEAQLWCVCSALCSHGRAPSLRCARGCTAPLLMRPFHSPRAFPAGAGSPPAPSSPPPSNSSRSTFRCGPCSASFAPFLRGARLRRGCAGGLLGHTGPAHPRVPAVAATRAAQWPPCMRSTAL